jgi:hypothetical protein
MARGITTIMRAGASGCKSNCSAFGHVSGRLINMFPVSIQPIKRNATKNATSRPAKD